MLDEVLVVVWFDVAALLFDLATGELTVAHCCRCRSRNCKGKHGLCQNRRL